MRSTGHCHSVYWVPHHIPDKDNPSSFQDGAPPIACEDEGNRPIFAEYWAQKITAVNSNPSRRPDGKNSISLPLEDIQNTKDFLNSILNRVQTHRSYRSIYCIRVNKNGNHYCRFYYPRIIRAKAKVYKDINPKRWQFAAKRDQPFCNPYAATLILA